MEELSLPPDTSILGKINEKELSLPPDYFNSWQNE
jgi:hypothetical protein